jgi:preprotein translocase subunit SecD
VALVLLVYGNPAIKGFSVTFLVGTLTTMFSSYYVTEVMGTWLIEKTKVKRFS